MTRQRSCKLFGSELLE